MARRCKRKKTITIIQDYGPAKKIRVCASYGRKKKGRKGKRRAKAKWCVFKGKRKGVAQGCFRTKLRAKKHAASLRRTCRARIRVRRSRAA